MLTLWFLLALVCQAAAREIDLAEATELALDHSLSLKRAIAVREAFYAAHRAAVAEQFPTLSATASATYRSDVSTLSLSIPGFPTLMRELGTEENFLTDVRLSVPLYTGGRIAATSSASEASFEAAAASEQQISEAVRYQTEVEYLNLCRADRVVEAAAAAVGRARTVERDVAARYTAGTADSMDLLDARLAVSRSGLDLQRAQTDRRSAELRLLTLLGLATSESLTVADSLLTPTPPSASRHDRHLNKAELEVAAAQIEQSRSLIKQARSELLPILSAYAGYTYGKPNLDMTGETWNDYYQVGVNISWSANLGGKTGRSITRMRHLYDAARSDSSAIAEQLWRDATIKWEQWQLAYERFSTAAEAAQIATAGYRLASERHRQGVLSSNRLLEAEAALTAAEADASAAVVECYLAEAAYNYSIGSSDTTKGTE
jgi:outer membrane protein TolC